MIVVDLGTKINVVDVLAFMSGGTYTFEPAQGTQQVRIE